MDQHRDVLAPHGRETDRIQRQNSLEELHKLIERLHAMRPKYKELIICAQQNLLDAQVLQKEIDTFVISLERPLIAK